MFPFFTCISESSRPSSSEVARHLSYEISKKYHKTEDPIIGINWRMIYKQKNKLVETTDHMSNSMDTFPPSDKIVVNYMAAPDKPQRLIVNNVKDRTVLVDHFRKVCNCPNGMRFTPIKWRKTYNVYIGCLQDESDPDRLLIAGNHVSPFFSSLLLTQEALGDTVVRPGIYKMFIPQTRFPHARKSLPSSSPTFSKFADGNFYGIRLFRIFNVDFLFFVTRWITSKNQVLLWRTGQTLEMYTTVWWINCCVISKPRREIRFQS